MPDLFAGFADVLGTDFLAQDVEIIERGAPTTDARRGDIPGNWVTIKTVPGSVQPIRLRSRGGRVNREGIEVFPDAMLYVAFDAAALVQGRAFRVDGVIYHALKQPMNVAGQSSMIQVEVVSKPL